MNESLVTYQGGDKRIAVYNTYADGRRLHFDVFIPTTERDVRTLSAELDAQAKAYAKEFLNLIGQPSDTIQLSLCERCHIDSTDAYRDQLWQLPGKDIYIWPLEGCPKPAAKR